MCDQRHQMQCAFEDLQTDFGRVLDIVEFLDDELNDDARVPVRHRILLQALHDELGRFREMLSKTNAGTLLSKTNAGTLLSKTNAGT